MLRGEEKGAWVPWEVSNTCNVFGHVVASKMLLGLRMRLSTECNASGVTNGVKRETAMRLAVFHTCDAGPERSDEPRQIFCAVFFSEPSVPKSNFCEGSFEPAIVDIGGREWRR